MQEAELRIGNWVQLNFSEWSSRGDDMPKDGNGFFQWSISDWNAYSECCLNLEQVDPIPLTEEILLKAGFGYTPSSATAEDNGADLFLTIGGRVSFMASAAQGYFYFEIEHNSGMGYNSLLRPPEYLHELQNLIHALTGEELQITF